MKTKNKDLSSWIWLFLPLLVLFSQYISKALNNQVYKRIFTGEMGLVELLTVLFLILATVFGIICLKLSFKSGNKLLILWFSLFSLGAFYFGGEEASWGQHLFGWSSPEFFQNINDQGETNLHNMGGVFDQLPRLILSLGALIGAVILPILIKLFKIDLSKFKLDLYIPTIVCLPSALIAVSVGFLDKLIDKNPKFLAFLNIVDGENKECFLALFLMLYILSIFKRFPKK